MRLHTLLATAALLSASTLAHAQYGLQPTPPPARPLTTPYDSRQQVPALAPPPKTFDVPATAQALKTLATVVAPVPRNTVCYALRTYTLPSETSSADITRPTASTTCQSARDTHLRDTYVLAPNK